MAPVFGCLKVIVECATSLSYVITSLSGGAVVVCREREDPREMIG